MKICNRCVAPETALNLVFAADGVCNLCHAYERSKEELASPERLRPLFEERLKQMRGRGRYDAVVGLSGGKDSSYVAWRLVHDYGLRLLLFTYDNGYLTDYARHNIRLMVDKLGQDHIFIGPDLPLQRVIARSSMKRVGVPCIGCTMPGFLVVLRIAVENEVPFIVHGRSPAQMFKELAPGSVDPFLPFLESNLHQRDEEQVRRFALQTSRKLLKRLRWFVGPEIRANKELLGAAQRLYAPDLNKLQSMPAPPEFLGFYLYHNYDENQIKQTLETELGWSRPEDDRFMGHEDCRVHAASVYLYTMVNGHPILQPELATLVRQGSLSREAALTRLEAEKEKHCLNEASFEHLQNLTQMTREELLSCARRSHYRLAAFRWLQKHILRRFRFFSDTEL